MVGDQHVKATYRCGDRTVSATVVFDDEHQLVDFVSDDRSTLSADGRTLTVQRWSTPISEHRAFVGRRAGAAGTGRWHPSVQRPGLVGSSPLGGTPGKGVRS